MKKSLIALSLFLLSSMATANCPYNGYIYPAGAVVGGLTCQTNGQWQ